MSHAVLGDRGIPWDEFDYLALGRTKDRVELIDGSLLVSPTPTPFHQTISRMLANALEPAAEAAGLQVYKAINIRLREGRMPIPDLVVTEPVNRWATVQAASVRLVCEIVSNPDADWLDKSKLYSAARIPWYLIVEEVDDKVLMSLLRLEGDHYTDHVSGASGYPFRMTEPVEVTLDPGELLPQQWQEDLAPRPRRAR